MSRPVALEDVRLAPPALPDGLARAARGGGRGARRPRGARAALPRQVVPGSAGAARGRLRVARRTRSSRRATRRRSRRCCGSAREAGVAVVPFGGGTSVVGGLGGRAAVRVARPRPAGPRGLGRSVVADRGVRAGDPAARGRCGAARAGAGARPRAAELRVGDGRRLRGDPLGRPDVDRPRADRRAGRGAGVRDAGRARWPRWTRPASAAGPVAARAGARAPRGRWA